MRKIAERRKDFKNSNQQKKMNKLKFDIQWFHAPYRTFLTYITTENRFRKKLEKQT